MNQFLLFLAIFIAGGLSLLAGFAMAQESSLTASGGLVDFVGAFAVGPC